MTPFAIASSRYVTLGSVYAGVMDLWFSVQNNTHYEFYDELDLDCNDRALLSETADNTVVNKYRLYSVVVHSRKPDEGNYSAFIRSNNKWYSFRDGVIKEVTESQAITAQFGQPRFSVGIRERCDVTTQAAKTIRSNRILQEP